MAVSNQLKTAAKVVKTPATPQSLGQARFSKPASGLDRVGVESSIALKGKKIKNLKLAANY